MLLRECQSAGGAEMRIASAVLLLMAAAAVVCSATTDQLVIAEKDPAVGGEPTFEGREVGDDIANPIVITELPYSTTGNTCAYLNDYDVACP